MLITLLDFFCSQPFPEQPKLKTRLQVMLSAALWAVVTFVLGLCFCNSFALPGENAQALVVFTGAFPSSEVTYPLLRSLIDLCLGAAPSVYALNLFGSALTGVMLALTWLLVYFWTRDAMIDDSVVGHASWVGQVAAHTVCLLFLFSLPGLYTLTAFTHHVWAFLLLLLCAVLQNAYAMHGGKTWRMAIFAFVFGVMLLESPWVALFAPLFLLRTLAIEWRLWDHNVRNLPLWFIMTVVGVLCATLFCATRVDGTWVQALQSMRYELPRLHYGYLREFFVGVPWLINFGAAVIAPILAWITARRLMNNERMTVLLITAIVLTVVSFTLYFGLKQTSLHIWLSRGFVPLATMWMFALACGMLIVGWAVQLFAKNPNLYEEMDRHHIPLEVTAMRVGAIFFFPLAVIAAGIILSLQSVRFFSIDRGMADRFALESVKEFKKGTDSPLEGYSFVLGRAWIDRHMALTARAEEIPLTIFSPERAQDARYLADLKHRLETDPVLGDADRLRLVHLLDYNFLVFIQDFFTAQPNVDRIAVSYDMPDVWYAAKLTRLRPEVYGTVYRGMPDGTTVSDQVLGVFQALQTRWEKTLEPNRLPWWDLNATVHHSIRHHLSVCANNLGTSFDDKGSSELNRAMLLQEDIRAAQAQQKTEEVNRLKAEFETLVQSARTHLTQAAECYYYARKINPESISALLNLYDICVRRGYLPERREEINKKFTDFIIAREKDSRKLNLSAVGRAFGYIRNYELFVQMGWDWAINAAPESVLAGLRNAQSGLSAADPRNAQVTSVVASIYELQGMTQRSLESYRMAIQHNPKNIEALRGLARLSIQEGKLREAGQYLAEAEAAGADKTMLDLDRAAYCMAIGDLDGATKAIGNYTTNNKDSAIGWAMLGMLEIEKGQEENLNAASGYILQNIRRTAKNSGDRYFQHILEGRLLHVKALRLEKELEDGAKTFSNAKAREEAQAKLQTYWEDARKQYRRAYALKTNVRGLLEIILDFDRRLGDKEGAEADAFAILRDDPHHAFANFVVGSQRLEDGEIDTAINYFKLAVEGMENPPADILNNYVDALARTENTALAHELGLQLVAQAPESYAAWGSYALVLARAGNVKEAKTALARSMEVIREAAKDDATRITPDPRLAYVKIWIAIAEKKRAEAEKVLDELKKHIGTTMTPLDKKDFTAIDSALQKLPRE